MRPDPKPTYKKGNQYYCSNGQRVTQVTINKKRSETKRFSLIHNPHPICEACEKVRADDPDHTIAQARCKVIHKTELIWDIENMPWSCRGCHHEWENFKSGFWTLHKNAERRLGYLKKHDPEGYRVRVELTKHSLQNENEVARNKVD